MFFVYLIQNTHTKELYIGYTDNLKRRLSEHNLGKNKSTYRKEGKWLLIYLESYKNQSDAREHEDKLKHHGSAKQKLKLRVKNSLL